MALTQAVQSSRPPLRVWPGVLIAVLLVLVGLVLPVVAPEAAPYGTIGALAAVPAMLIWWLFFSRAPWIERVGAILVTIAAYFVIKPLLHPSIVGGMMGMMFAVYAIPKVLLLAFVIWAVATRRLPDRIRRVTMVATILLACGVWTLFRTEGIKGEGTAQLRWRWTKTAEERLLARGHELAPAPPPRTADAAPPAAPPSAAAPNESLAGTPSHPGPAAAQPGDSASPAPVSPASGGGTRLHDDSPSDRAESRGGRDPGSRRVAWPGFRGPERDGVIRDVSIRTDWSSSPPVELWRRPIGPGWSSFAVDGDRFYTQEQRGEEEVVSCYSVSTGEPVWQHRDPVRFYESNAGAGPRATPTVHDGRVYTLGATGLLNALDATTGAVVWSRNAAADTGAPLPGWGFAGSPLVLEDLVIVAASGRLAGYDRATGRPRWTQSTGGGGYSSPHLATIHGVTQVLLVSAAGITSVAPGDGAVLWKHAWPLSAAIVQPALAADGDILLALGDMMGGAGMRRLGVSRGASGWTVEERWTSRGLKPYFNDFVVHEGHAYGFDGSILACIDLADGERKWKGGRYGQGQLVLLRDQDVLLVLSEDGELVLVGATSDQLREITRFKAIEGKTWNHPVIVGDLLLVRNGEEMAAFRLPPAGR